MTSRAEKDFEKYSVGGLYRLLNNPGNTVSGLAPTFGKSRGQARKYVKLALGLGLVVGEVNPRGFTRRGRKYTPWDRYYSRTPRGDRVLKWLSRYADGNPYYGYPDPPLLGASTRRRPRFPRRL